MTETHRPRQISDLVKVMETLLSPQGCPWDREQTAKTLVPYAIEEAHELAEAIEAGDTESYKEELGDLLLQIVFHSALAGKSGKFTLEDVIEIICTKLIRRHPHVFGEVKVKDSGEVLKNWEIIKGEEKKGKKQKASAFAIPVSLPALQRAHKIGEKTRGLKFDWQTPAQVLEKVEEEMGELKNALAAQDLKNIEEELGDVFFVLAQLARHLKFEAETVARAANRKFEGRFEKLLALAAARKMGEFKDIPISEKEALWKEVKRSK